MNEPQEQQEQQSLEFDIEKILETNPNPISKQSSAQQQPPPLPKQVPPPAAYPDFIMTANHDDQQTISTLDRDQRTLATRDDPPIAMFRPSFDPDKFADEEAPSLPKFSYKQKIRYNKSDQATRRLNPNSEDSLSSRTTNRSISSRDLYIVVLVMSLLLLAIITGLAIWLIALKTNDTLNTGSTQGDASWLEPPSVSPTTFRLTSPPSTSPTTEEVIGTIEPTYAIPLVTQTPTVFPMTVPPKTASPTITQITDAPLPPPTPFPTLVQTPFPTLSDNISIQNARSKFLQVLESKSVSSVTTLGRLDSPQYQAFDWLVQDPNFESYSNERLLQRWVLATFALGLKDAQNDDGGDITTLSVYNKQVPKNKLPVPQALQSWVQYTDECSWFFSQQKYEYLCNPQGLYSRIDLRSQNLSGTIPTEISLLSSHLEFIFLFDNYIHGTLPTELALLHKLERLEVTRNLLEGTIPTELGNLSELVFLGLGVNYLSGALPSEMGRLDKLRTIGLERNQLTSKIPTEIGNMVETRLLYLDRNQFTGSLPQSLERMTLLRGMNLSFNSQLVGRIPNLLCAQHPSYLQADCDNIDCPCCTTCHYHNYDS